MMTRQWEQFIETDRVAFADAIDRLVVLVQNKASRSEIEQYIEEAFEYFTMMYTDALLDINEKLERGELSAQEGSIRRTQLEERYTQEALLLGSSIFKAIHNSTYGRK